MHPKKTTPKNQNQKLLNQALNFLKIRARSRQEIYQFLSKKTPQTGLINQVVNYLDELKLINDRDFASWYIDSRLRHKPRGPRVIRQELIRLGVDQAIISEVFSTIDDEVCRQAAMSYLEKKAKNLAKFPVSTAKLKASSYLFARGFDARIRSSVIDEFFSRE
jgi:regulatory protein